MRTENVFLVSGHGLACQSEISLVLAKTPPIHYETIDNSMFNNYASSYVINMRVHHVSRGASLHKHMPNDDFGKLLFLYGVYLFK